MADKYEKQRELTKRIAQDVNLLDVLGGFNENQEVSIAGIDVIFGDLLVIDIKLRTLDQHNAVFNIQGELNEYDFAKAKRKLDEYKKEGVYAPEFSEFEKLIQEHEEELAERKHARETYKQIEAANALKLKIFDNEFHLILSGKIIVNSKYETFKEDDTSYSHPCYIFDDVNVWTDSLAEVKDYRGTQENREDTK